MNGHDCSHGSFSNSYILNTIFGHISYVPLLVPYSTWAESHRRHHLGHNHKYKDYSHKWINTNDLSYIDKIGMPTDDNIT